MYANWLATITMLFSNIEVSGSHILSDLCNQTKNTATSAETVLYVTNKQRKYISSAYLHTYVSLQVTV